jgi:hypothetical protein
MQYWLEVSIPKNMKDSWDYYSQYIKKKMLETTNQNNIMLKHKTTDTTRYSNWDIFHPLISGVSE